MAAKTGADFYQSIKFVAHAVTILKLYSKPDCHLCDQMFEQLKPYLGESVQLEFVDITTSAELLRKYGLRIPVLGCGEADISGFPLNEQKLLAFLARE